MKRTVFTTIVLTLTFLLVPGLHFGQSNNDMVKKVQELLEENYIFLDKAKQTNAHLDELMQQNFFKDMAPADFAKSLTEELRKYTKDKHLRFSAPRPKKDKDNTEVVLTESLGRYRSSMLRGFQLMESNIGYIDLAFFGGSKRHLSKIDLVMQEMQLADAIIVDMRRNGGGSPVTVNYLSSHFFNEKLLLNTIYSRADDHTEEMWVVDVKGTKRPKVPVYILTSERTFSGAEDFSYTMQSRGRATVLGEVTGGGAHPTRFFPLGNGFGIGIPFARTINPVTKTNWEGVGVIPDIKLPADDALEKAKELAKASADEYKNSFFSPLEKTLSELENKEITKKVEDDVLKNIKHLVQINMLNEGEINGLGYSYFQTSKIKTAILIFKTNIALFPNSANVYDSYAEALAENDQKDLALMNYKKAVETATKQKDPQLETFQNNLKTFQEKK